MSNDETFLKWRTKNTKRYEFYVHKILEKDVYEHLESISNKRQYLLDLIKKDIKKKAH